jgi:hypothetical protein
MSIEYQALEIMEQSLRDLHTQGITSPEMIEFYKRYQVGWYKRRFPDLRKETIEALAQTSTRKRLSDTDRMDKLRRLMEDVNSKKGGICEFLARYIGFKLEKQEIDYKLALGWNSYVIVNMTKLSPEDYWGELIREPVGWNDRCL